jgi:hypothetical protein
VDIVLSYDVFEGLIGRLENVQEFDGIWARQVLQDLRYDGVW